MTADQEVLLLRRLDALEQQVADLRAGRLTRSDRAVLEHLLPAWRGGHGCELLTAKEVCCSSRPGVRFVVGLHRLTPRSLGKLLRKACGIPVQGHLVETHGTEANARLWRVVEFLEAPL